jgi:hypothetical protein
MGFWHCVCHVSARRNAGVNGRGTLAPCRDTDDTNRACRDTRTIRRLAKMAGSETSPDVAAVHDLAWKPTTSRGLWIAAAVLYPANPGAIQVCSCSCFTRLLLVQLIFLVTDRSCSHGHAP